MSTCAWCCMYFPATSGRPAGEEPTEFGSSVMPLDTHGMCERCQEHFLAGEGPRWQVWESKPGMGVRTVAALPVAFDRGQVTGYRVRDLYNGGSDKVLSSQVLSAHWQFTGQVLEEVEA